MDIKALAAEVFRQVEAFVDRRLKRVDDALLGLGQRVDAIKEGPRGEKGDPGRDGRDGSAGRDGDKGEKGDPGIDGRDGRDGERGPQGERGDPGARGEKGDPGRDGKDGMSLENFDAQFAEDGRTLILSLSDGERVIRRELRLAVVIYRGLFQAGRKYAEGDSVTYGGSLWIAKRETNQSPGNDSADWQLAAKRGRDGKDAVPPSEG